MGGEVAKEASGGQQDEIKGRSNLAIASDFQESQRGIVARAARLTAEAIEIAATMEVSGYPPPTHTHTLS